MQSSDEMGIANNKLVVGVAAEIYKISIGYRNERQPTCRVIVCGQTFTKIVPNSQLRLHKSAIHTVFGRNVDSLQVMTKK